MNQGCDKRRNGTRPKVIESNANKISELFKGKIEFSSVYYKEILSIAKYYAYPEQYLHIAGKEERHLHLTFKAEEIDLYNMLIE